MLRHGETDEVVRRPCKYSKFLAGRVSGSSSVEVVPRSVESPFCHKRTMPGLPRSSRSRTSGRRASSQTGPRARRLGRRRIAAVRFLRMIGATSGDETVVVEAPALLLYEMVSDITRMGEWSPECR